MGDIIKSILVAIIPPRNPSPERLRSWGFAVVGVLIAMSTWTVGSTILAFGLMPGLFGPGFVHADQFDALKQLGMDIRVSQIERTIKDAKTDLCYVQSDPNGNQRQLELASQALMSAITEWQRAKNTTAIPRIPDCSELVVAKK